MTLEDRIVAEAKGWVGVRFKDKGRDRYGVDCIGLVIKVAHSLGLSQYDTVEYPRRPSSVDFLRGMKDHLVAVPLAKAGHGHVAVFRGPRVPVHCGILEVDGAGRMWVIHAFAPAGRVIREPVDEAGERDAAMVMVFRYASE